MNFILPLTLLFLSTGALATEELCTRPPASPPNVQAELGAQFKRIAADALEWTMIPPPPACRVAMSNPHELADALGKYRVVFVTMQIGLCDKADAFKLRLVDGSPDPETGEILVHEKAWKEADEAERLLFVTHELAGVARRTSEPWTTSVCWALPGLIYGGSRILLPQTFRERPLLLASGGGSTGGRGGGDLGTAGLKFRAYKALVLSLFGSASIEEISRGSRCGIDVEMAFAAWLALPIDSESSELGSVPIPIELQWNSKLDGPSMVIRGVRSPARKVSDRQILDWSYEMLYRAKPRGLDKDCLDALL